MQPPPLSLSGPQEEPKHPKADKGQKVEGLRFPHKNSQSNKPFKRERPICKTRHKPRTQQHTQDSFQPDSFSGQSFKKHSLPRRPLPTELSELQARTCRTELAQLQKRTFESPALSLELCTARFCQTSFEETSLPCGGQLLTAGPQGGVLESSFFGAHSLTLYKLELDAVAVSGLRWKFAIAIAKIARLRCTQLRNQQSPRCLRSLGSTPLGSARDSFCLLDALVGNV